MDEEDKRELDNQVWESWMRDEISPNEVDKQLEDNEEEYRRYGN